MVTTATNIAHRRGRETRGDPSGRSSRWTSAPAEKRALVLWLERHVVMASTFQDSFEEERGSSGNRMGPNYLVERAG